MTRRKERFEKMGEMGSETRRGVIAAVAAACLCSQPVRAQLPPPPPVREETSPQPSLFVDQRIRDLGRILAGDKPIVTWTLENRGRADLVIERTKTSCGCTVVQLRDEDKVIPPGGSLPLQVQFDSTGRRGPQNKIITIYSNDPAEPILKLELLADVAVLYEIDPPKLMNLRSVRRGTKVKRTIDLCPGPGRHRVEIIGLESERGTPLAYEYEPFEKDGASCQRISLQVQETAALGPLLTDLTIRFRVDDIERAFRLPIRGEVIGDVIWRPRVIAATQSPMLPGHRLAPVVLRSVEGIAFDVVGADAGPRFEVTVEPSAKPTRKRKEYNVLLTLRKDAPPGPFASMLTIRTTLLDQPVIRVPVFGIVAAPVEVDPPVVLLRRDGTPRGQRRRLRIQVPPRSTLDVTEVRCDNPAVKATLDEQAIRRYRHIRFIDVVLQDRLPPGRVETTLRIRTNVPGREELSVPVVIEVPTS